MNTKNAQSEIINDAKRADDIFKQQQLEYIYDAGNFSAKQAEMIFQRAWENGHAYGYNEVHNYIADIVEWIDDFNNC